MKKYLFFFIVLLFVSFKSNGQVFTQTFVDKCSGEIKVATTTYVNGNAVVSFYNQIRTFTPAEVQSGVLQAWLQATYAAYSTLACPTNVVVQQTVTQTVSQAAAQAASQAASSAASAAASSAASGAASSAASGAASSSASAAASGSASTAATSSKPPPSSGSSSSSSTSSGSSSSETKTESGSSSSSESKTESKSESKTESKSEEKKEDSKSESKEEKKEEKKSEEKKEEKKKEEKKQKQQNTNPLLIASDLTTAENVDGTFNAILNVGVSKSSLMGDKSYNLTGMVWSTLNQFALSAGMTTMDLKNGKLNAINSYSSTFAYLNGTLMNLLGYTWVKPHPKYGTYGYNVGMVSLMSKTLEDSYSLSFSTSVVAFWTKPFQYSKKLTLSPQVFVMSSPIAFNTTTNESTINKHFGFLLGSSFDYKITRRFGFSFNYKANLNTTPGTKILHNFLIGSRVML